MKTKVSVRNDYVSTTDPNDPEAVPAFETSVGLPKRSSKKKDVFVNQRALAAYNGQMDPAAMKFQAEAANVAALFQKKAIRPDEIAALRRRMFEVVTKGLESAAEVIEGRKEWNNTQVRLFSILTERVMPKLTNVTVEDLTSRKLEDLSVEELEKIAMGKVKHQAVDALVKQGLEEDRQEERITSGEVDPEDRKRIRKLAIIGAGEQAMKEKRSKEVAAESVGKPGRKSSRSTRKGSEPT
jgi:hypothetical protein